MCCLKPMVTASLDVGPLQLDLLNATCSGSARLNVPLVSVPPSVVSAASPAVEMTFAVVDASYVRSTPGVNAPNAAGVPSVRARVAGTEPPASPVCWLMSVTTTSKDFVAEALPLASIAVQDTCVVPTANVVPEAFVQVTVGFESCVSVVTVV